MSFKDYFIAEAVADREAEVRNLARKAKKNPEEVLAAVKRIADPHLGNRWAKDGAHYSPIARFLLGGTSEELLTDVYTRYITHNGLAASKLISKENSFLSFQEEVDAKSPPKTEDSGLPGAKPDDLKNHITYEDDEVVVVYPPDFETTRKISLGTSLCLKEKENYLNYRIKEGYSTYFVYSKNNKDRIYTGDENTPYRGLIVPFLVDAVGNGLYSLNEVYDSKNMKMFNSDRMVPKETIIKKFPEARKAFEKGAFKPVPFTEGEFAVFYDYFVLNQTERFVEEVLGERIEKLLSGPPNKMLYHIYEKKGMINDGLLNKLLESCINGKFIKTPDGIIVTGYVSISRGTYSKLPWKFFHVSGDFYCYSTHLKSLEGFPKGVKGDVYICGNPHLTSLTGAPERVWGDFDCSENPSLISLEGAPESVDGYFDCANNPSLKSLLGGPKKVGKIYDCSNNPSLTSLEGAPRSVLSFHCNSNPSLKSLTGCPEKVSEVFLCVGNSGLTDLRGSPKKVRHFKCNNNSLTSLTGAPERVDGNFDCSFNKLLTSLKGAPREVGEDFVCKHNNSMTSLRGGPHIVGNCYICSSNPSLESLDGAPKKTRSFLCQDNPLLSSRIFHELKNMEVGDTMKLPEHLTFLVKNGKLIGTPPSILKVRESENFFHREARQILLTRT